MGAKIWRRLFFNIIFIFAVFVFALSLSSRFFLYDFFLWQQQWNLKTACHNIQKWDLSASDQFINSSFYSTLEDIESKNNFYIKIYTSTKTIYASSGTMVTKNENGYEIDVINQPVDILRVKIQDANELLMIKEDPINQLQYLSYLVTDSRGYVVEVRTQMNLLNQSAQIASQFMGIVSCVCLLGSLFWIAGFSTMFSKPIVEMNEITKDMANLNFSRKLEPNTKDEIGQLGHSINHLSNKLDQTLDDLKAKNSRLQYEIDTERSLEHMRKSFVANVSHELKTPIAIIRGYAEGLKLNMEDGVFNENYWQVIMDESDHMNRLVMDLLQLSKIESGQMNLVITEFDLFQIVKGVLNKIFAAKQERCFTLENQITETMMVKADDLRVEQVLTNYLNNAGSHVNENGLIRISAEENKSYFRINVYNTGNGIADEDLPQIWQSFYRADKSHKREGRYGLGLSIVLAIQKLHGGECGVYNTGDGVCFWFDVKKAANPPS